MANPLSEVSTTRLLNELAWRAKHRDEKSTGDDNESWFRDQWELERGARRELETIGRAKDRKIRSLNGSISGSQKIINDQATKIADYERRLENQEKILTRGIQIEAALTQRINVLEARSRDPSSSLGDSGDGRASSVDKRAANVSDMLAKIQEYLVDINELIEDHQEVD